VSGAAVRQLTRQSHSRNYLDVEQLGSIRVAAVRDAGAGRNLHERGQERTGAGPKRYDKVLATKVGPKGAAQVLVSPRLV
jgi:hypothetical protein